VATIYEARAYNTAPYWWRLVEAVLGGAIRASDIRLYWGPNGAVDSVIDVTWNVPVPFDSTAGGGWGFLNEADQATPASGDRYPTHATVVDVATCVPPFSELPVSTFLGGCGAADRLHLTRTAVPGAVAFASGDTVPAVMNAGNVLGSWLNLHPAAQPGLVLYIAGHLYTFELEGGQLPPDGTVWTLRSYVGVVNGGQGRAGNQGPYTYEQVHPAPFTAVGAEIHVQLEATNDTRAVTASDLAAIHTVPDPFYLRSGFDGDAVPHRAIQFVNLPQRAAIRIYTSSGVLVDVIEHVSTQFGGTAVWDLKSRNGKDAAPGVYFYHVESDGEQVVKRFTIVPE
jgi:hypothetical protein